MYEIQKDEYAPVNFFAGDFPIVTDTGTVASGAVIHKFTPVARTADGIAEADPAALDSLVGIAASEPSGDEVVYYLTGEFFAAALALPSGVTIDALKPAFRNIGIFLK